MTIIKELRKRVEELEQESKGEGFERAIYGHTSFGHTVETRAKMLNHKRLMEQIGKEIKHLLDELEKKVAE